MAGVPDIILPKASGGAAFKMKFSAPEGWTQRRGTLAMLHESDEEDVHSSRKWRESESDFL